MAKFKLVETHIYWWPVEVKLPDPEKSGKVLTQSFEAQFEALPIDEAKALDRELQKMKSAGEVEAHQAKLLKRVVKNWRGVEADNGGDEPFTEAAFDQALRFAWFRAGCYQAYAGSLSGDEARLGN